MHWSIYSLIIAIFAIFDIYITKVLSKGKLTAVEISSTFFLIMGIISIIFSLKNIHYNFDTDFWNIFLKACTVIVISYTMQTAANLQINMGLITGLSFSIFLPLITFIMYLAYNETITQKQLIGMVLSCFSIYFLLS